MLRWSAFDLPRKRRLRRARRSKRDVQVTVFESRAAMVRVVLDLTGAGMVGGPAVAVSDLMLADQSDQAPIRFVPQGAQYGTRLCSPTRSHPRVHGRAG